MIELQEKATKQETFDFVVGKLREQGRPATRDGFCIYGEPGGDRCAIGHLMPGACEVQGNLERLIRDGVVKPPSDSEFFGKLQLTHDRAAATDEVFSIKCAILLIGFARIYNLDHKSASYWLAEANQ